jgi:hypothetical protein
MPFTHTTQVPPGSADAVLNLPNTIKMIVIGNDQELAKRADNRAKLPPLLVRKVVWFSNGLPPNLQNQFAIQPNAVVFVLDTNNVVRDTILAGEPTTNIRLEQAYVNGAQ